ncbi:MAG: hypothetical protein OWU84_06545 [Firmicutes bacterium]|nr:hypothetical protein [Bacillota bacterium]
MEPPIPTAIKELDAVHGYLTVDHLKIDPWAVEALRRYPSSEWDAILGLALMVGFKVMEVISPEDWSLLRRVRAFERLRRLTTASADSQSPDLQHLRRALRALDWQHLRRRWEEQMERDVAEWLAEWLAHGPPKT